MAKIKTVRIDAELAKDWYNRKGLHNQYSKGMDKIIAKWNKKGYRLIDTTPITKTKKRFLRSPVVETTHFLLTFQKD